MCGFHQPHHALLHRLLHSQFTGHSQPITFVGGWFPASREGLGSAQPQRNKSATSWMFRPGLPDNMFIGPMSRPIGGNGRLRTSGLRLIKALLYQLSYITMDVGCPSRTHRHPIFGTGVVLYNAHNRFGKRSCLVVLSRELPGIRFSQYIGLSSCNLNRRVNCYFCIGPNLRFDFDIRCN